MNLLEHNDLPAIRRVKELIANPHHVRVLFICLGNICRSPAAEGIMLRVLKERKDNSWVVDSAGMGDWHIGDLPDSRMRMAAGRRGIKLEHRCRQVHESDFDDFDIIIGMDRSNVDGLKRLAPTVEAMEKVLPMSAFFSPSNRADCVPDPYYGGAEGFEKVLDLLTEATGNLYDTMSTPLA